MLRQRCKLQLAQAVSYAAIAFALIVCFMRANTAWGFLSFVASVWLGKSFLSLLQARNETETKFKTIAEGIPQLVWTARPDGTVEYANGRWSDYTGLLAQQTLDWGWQQAIHPDDLGRNLALWQQGRTKGEEVTAEFRLRRHDGVYRWHMVRGRPLKDATGKVIRWLGTVTDIEEQKEAHEAIQKALTARNELLSICSHELRTPVAAMKLHTQMALRNIAKTAPGALEAETVQQWLAHSNKQLDRLIRLIEEMLDFSRVIGGRLKLNTEPFDLSQLVDEVSARFAPRIEEAKSGLECLLERPMVLTADRSRVEQVLTNVLGNAIQYAPGKPIRVTLKAEDKKVKVVVEDEGPGIAAPDIDRIFEPYERATSPMHISGLGLGLYISRQILVAHGGTIQAENPAWGGARFSIELPR